MSDTEPPMEARQAGTPNRLIDETSPYLLQHAHNPVDWYPWGEEALTRAKEQDKPILLSIGYAACHWCHMMARESFEDPGIAALMNDGFVCIKVDREERPDLDSIYMKALSAMGGDVGWPMTVFLTPEQIPFHAGTYFPPTERHGLPAFPSVLRGVRQAWRDQRAQILREGPALVNRLASERRLGLSGELPGAELLPLAVARMRASFDDKHGGWGDPPKFPQPQVLGMMIRAAAQGAGRAKEMAEKTLRSMALGGIYDQVGGGFHRYSVDSSWLVPHFEKMLHDNAGLARVYIHAWQAWRVPLYKRIAEETLEWLIREMHGPGGGFFSSMDAESEGEEGRFYVWSYKELMDVAHEAASYYGATREGNFGGKTNILTAASDDPPREVRTALFMDRSKRVWPDRDDKVLASWNGLAITALAEAGAALGRDDFVNAATQAAAFVLEELRADSGRLMRSYRGGRATVPGMLEDYAYVSEALLTLWEVTFQPEWIQACKELATLILELFWDQDEGGFYSTASDQEQLILREKEMLDTITACPAAVASLVLKKLSVITGEQSYAQRGDQALHLAAPYLQAMPQETASWAATHDIYLAAPREIAIVGDASHPGTRALVRQVWERFIPSKVMAGAPPGIKSPLLEGKREIDGRPTAFVCEGYVCRTPTTDPTELGRLLRTWTPPSPQQVDRAVSQLERPLQYKHFFDKLENPKWMRPLKERGFFSKPPPPIWDYAQGTVGSPPWPESQYLLRMAPHEPETVQQIALEIPDVDNTLVYEDLADIASALTPRLAAELVPRAETWLKAPYQLLLPQKLGPLLGHLVRGGQIEAALELAGTLMAVLPAPADPATQDLAPSDPEPRARFEQLQYEQILKEYMPDLVLAAGLSALELLCDLLDEAIRLSRRPGEDTPPSDHSHMWRPAIEEQESVGSQTLKEVLTTAVRDAASQIAEANPSKLPELVETLERRPRHIFRRVALHLLRTVPEADLSLMRARLTDREAFENPHFHHEYLLLARDCLLELPEQEQEQILEWIEAGPDLDRWKEAAKRVRGYRPSDEEAFEHRKRWSQKRLGVLAEALPDAWQRRHEELTAELGPPQSPEFASPPGVGSRRASPKSAEDLGSMSVQEVVGLLKTWHPSAEWGAPSHEGLARELTLAVAADPKLFAGGLDEFRDLHPAYAQGLASGFFEAIRRSVPFSWGPVIAFCRGVVDRGDEAGARGGAEDPWSPPRRQIAQLLGAGLAPGPAEIPLELRPRVWETLQPLTGDPEPTPGQEARWKGAGADLETICTNTVRGKALQAVVRYALWVRRHLEQAPDAQQTVGRGFDEMPEVREALASHLADPSLALCSAYGGWFPWLLLLDPQWTGRQVSEIFPRGAELPRLAAWEAYITLCGPYENVFDLLEGEYAAAVQRIEPDARPVPGPPAHEKRLAEHLMSFYLRGRLRLDPDGLLARFFRRAPDTLRAHALASLGRSLRTWKGPLPGEVRERLKALWERRLGAATADGASSQQLELQSFGWWFASGKLDDAWTFPQLGDALRRTGRVDATTAVVQRLAQMAPAMPSPAVECLRLILEGGGGRAVIGWHAQGRKIVADALESGDATAREVALGLMDAFTIEDPAATT